jgi:hypothetical protein
MISGQSPADNFRRDSVLLHFYLAPDMYPSPLATRNKTRSCQPSPACLMYNARRNEDERTLLMQTKPDAAPDEDSSRHVASTSSSSIFVTVTLRVKSY